MYWDPAPLASAVGLDGISYWWKPAEGAARVVAGERTGFPAMAFEQVNPGLAHTIRANAVEALGDVTGKIVWDLYGGVGDTARALSARGARVWSVDADRGAVEWAVAAERGEREGITYVAASVEHVLGRLPEPYAAVVNPPRTGLDARVSEWLNRWAGAASATARRLVYVSCDPATLARDLKRMPNLELVDLTAYDLFPQTAHVETLAVLVAK
jgi:23S rRNA (uracil1939-C5)-methyltransferase